jgi:hypothetical protein
MPNYAQGGALPAGTVVAYNGTGEPEAIGQAKAGLKYLLQRYGDQTMNLDEQIARLMAPSAAECRRAEHRVDVHRADVQRAHEQLRQDATGLLGELLDLHAPHTDQCYSTPVCEGCDAEGYDVESPRWPCRTYRLIAEGTGREFTGTEPHVRMTRKTG